MIIIHLILGIIGIVICISVVIAVVIMPFVINNTLKTILNELKFSNGLSYKQLKQTGTQTTTQQTSNTNSQVHEQTRIDGRKPLKFIIADK